MCGLTVFMVVSPREPPPRTAAHSGPVGQLKCGIHSIESIDEIPHLRQSWGRTGSPILKSCGTRTLPPPRRPADAHGGDSKDRNFDMYRLSRRFIVYMRGGIHILYIIKLNMGPGHSYMVHSALIHTDTLRQLYCTQRKAATRARHSGRAAIPHRRRRRRRW